MCAFHRLLLYSYRIKGMGEEIWEEKIAILLFSVLNLRFQADFFSSTILFS